MWREVLQHEERKLRFLSAILSNNATSKNVSNPTAVRENVAEQMRTRAGLDFVCVMIIIKKKARALIPMV